MTPTVSPMTLDAWRADQREHGDAFLAALAAHCDWWAAYHMGCELPSAEPREAPLPNGVAGRGVLTQEEVDAPPY